jgi:Zn-finger nucleic acid-binding protein
MREYKFRGKRLDNGELEKQIPKKPELVPEPYDDGIEQITRYIDLPYCPNCGDLMVDFTGHKHCTNCGQAIDWSGEDE